MGEIITNKGEVIIVDDDLVEELSQYTWMINRRQRRGKTSQYVVRKEWNNNEETTIYMHRQITNASKEDVVDHKNRNTLDNRRENLRNTTYSHNEQNKEPYGVTGLKGVYLHKSTSKFMCRIHKDGKNHHLGYFENKFDAARMYNFWALDLYGEDAYINKIPG